MARILFAGAGPTQGNTRMVNRPAARPARTAARSWRACLLLALCAVAAGASAQSQAPSRKTLKLRVVGGLAGISQYVRHEEPFWTRELSRLSDGRFSAEIVPFDRAGVPGYDMLTLLRLGVVPFGTALLSQVAGQYPELGAPDLAGLTPDVPTLRKVVDAFRPALERLMAEGHGAKLLAIYMYPAQVVFCREALKGAEDLAARKVRVSSATQSDFVRALGAEHLNRGRVLRGGLGVLGQEQVVETRAAQGDRALERRGHDRHAGAGGQRLGPGDRGRDRPVVVRRDGRAGVRHLRGRPPMSAPRTDAYAALLGIDVTGHGGGRAEARAQVTDDHLNPHGTAHGSFLFSLAGIALAAAANDDEHSGVVSAVHIDYVRPARPGDALLATAEVAERLAKEDLFVVRVTHGDELVARATGRANRRAR